MKRLEEFNDSELLELTDKGVLNLIDYECALEGVPMLPPSPGPKPKANLPEPDTQCFAVAGVMTCDADHARRILEAICGGWLVESTYDSDYHNRYLKRLCESDYNYPKITTETHRSQEQWDSIKEEATKFNMLKKEWEAKNDEYEKALKARSTITDRVYGQIESARHHFQTCERLREEFKRYLELAEGNRQIALNFLDKARDLSEFPELYDEFCPKEVEEETTV